MNKKDIKFINERLSSIVDWLDILKDGTFGLGKIDVCNGIIANVYLIQEYITTSVSQKELKKRQ